MASSVNLGAKLEATVDELVKNGRYGSRSEVLRAGVRLIEEHEAKWLRFHMEIEKGLVSLEQGDGVDLDKAFDRIRARMGTVAAKRAA